ncbi:MULTISPECIES: replication protein RepA [unclassified Acidisoma]|jgi:Plasmid encoded RepA protein|uniref:replication protein RepA n=1 Tax=unclassified Acidisoma TaxID=2634065 RepID=UPI00131DAAF0|nr:MULTISPECIES: replication protein RepA [unclassified Acidisoma]
MGTVHTLIESRGRLGALGFDFDRRIVETAANYMADEDNGIGFVYSGWAQAALPHRRLKDDQTWQINSDHVKLLIEPGRRATEVGDPIWVGVPYGSRARLIMLYLQTEALRTNSREIELGKSLRNWLSRLGIPIGGKSLKDVREQAERISRCRLTFHVQAAGRAGLVNQNIMDTAMFVDGADPAQGSLFLETAKLSETFYEQLRKHPVPLEEAAIRAINNNSMALDLYCWLAYRLHVLTGPRQVTWKALMGQFGGGYKEQFHFKPRFLENLSLAMAVYRDAKVDIDEKGLTLRPSRPPVPQKQGVAAAR